MPTPKLAHKLQHLQNSCQLKTWHTCCTHAKLMPTLDLARMLHPCKTHANSAP